MIALGTVVLFCFVYSRGSPTDAAMVQQFNRNRAVFVELNAMLSTNSPVDPLRETMSPWSLEHYKRYGRLLRQARVRQVFREGNEIRFQVAGPPAPAKCRRIAVSWTDTEPEPIVASIDDFHKLPGKPDHAYRSLGEGWFLWIAN